MSDYVSVYMIIVYIQMGFRLVPSCLNRINKFVLLYIKCFGIFAYVICVYLCHYVTQIKAVNVRVLTHRKVLSDRVLLVACHIIEDKNGIWKCLVRWYSLLLENIKKNQFLQSELINSPSIGILAVASTSSTHTRSQNICECGLSSKFINTFVLQQFVEPQMIPRRNRQYVSMLAYFSVCILLSTLITLIVSDHL